LRREPGKKERGGVGSRRRAKKISK
jgi:hypothetical protein